MQQGKELYEALGKVTAFLDKLALHHAVDTEDTTIRFTGRHEHYGEMTLGQVLNEADKALAAVASNFEK